ncbi:MAG TPA: imelysin family protein [Flavipsychrobacter sp.]|nr:imelysin family protein [Flavipsychrobacter sp.]
MKKLLLAFGMITVLFPACTKKDNGNNDNNDLNRKNMLSNYAENYVIPAYANMLGKLTELKTKTESFTATPNEANLDALQQSWREAYTIWQRTEMLEFDPAEDASLRMYMNIYPVSVTKVNSNIASGTYNLEAFGSTDVQGFPALDFLLNGLAATNADIVGFYITDPLAQNRKKYLQDVVNKMVEKTQTVNNAWASYKTTFTDRTGTDVNSSLSKMVNAYVLYYERYLRSGKIGLPAGAMTGNALPQLTEAYYTPSLSNELAKTALNAVSNFYEGKSYDGATDGAGIKDYLASIGTMDKDKLMSDIISDEMNEAITALNNLNTPIKEAVVNNRPAVLGLYDQLQDVVPLLKVDMVSAFGISITYVDNDGD